MRAAYPPLVRIAHVTDIHVQQPPEWSELNAFKRVLGAANLYLAGRVGHFQREVQEALVQAVRQQEPDLLACTGDLTAMSTDSEWAAAKQLLGPMFEGQPSVLIPGNHDVYVAADESRRPIEQHFGDYTGAGDWPRVHVHGGVRFIGVDVCKARWILSHGVADPEMLKLLDEVLAQPFDGFTFVMLHYPLRGRRGEPYGPNTRNIENAAAVEEVLLGHQSAVGAILHGHEHHGFRVSLGDIPILNPGSSGYAWLPKKGRTAHFCVYTVEDKRLASVDRFRFDGEAFVPEPGGAWATGG